MGVSPLHRKSHSRLASATVWPLELRRGIALWGSRVWRSWATTSLPWSRSTRSPIQCRRARLRRSRLRRKRPPPRREGTKTRHWLSGRDLKLLPKRKRRSQRSLWTTSRQPPWISDSRPQTKQSTVTPATTSSTSALLRRATRLRNAKSTPDTTDHYVLVNGLTSGTKRGRTETTLVATEGEQATFFTLVRPWVLMAVQVCQLMAFAPLPLSLPSLRQTSLGAQNAVSEDSLVTAFQRPAETALNLPVKTNHHLRSTSASFIDPIVRAGAVEE